MAKNPLDILRKGLQVLKQEVQTWKVSLEAKLEHALANGGDDDIDNNADIEPCPTRREVLQAVAIINKYLNHKNNCCKLGVGLMNKTGLVARHKAGTSTEWGYYMYWIKPMRDSAPMSLVYIHKETWLCYSTSPFRYWLISTYSWWCNMMWLVQNIPTTIHLHGNWMLYLALLRVVCTYKSQSTCGLLVLLVIFLLCRLYLWK